MRRVRGLRRLAIAWAFLPGLAMASFGYTSASRRDSELPARAGPPRIGDRQCPSEVSSLAAQPETKWLSPVAPRYPMGIGVRSRPGRSIRAGNQDPMRPPDVPMRRIREWFFPGFRKREKAKP